MDPVQTASTPVSDVAGIIVFDSQVPNLDINISRGVTTIGGVDAVDLTVPGSTGIQLLYNLFTSPPGNVGDTLSFSGLVPDYNNQVFYQSFGGVTFATEVIATALTGVPLIVKNGTAVVAPSNQLNPILNTFTPNGVLYNDNYWYAYGSNFIMSPNGMNWSGTETDCPFLDTVSGLAFDNAGMGVLTSTQTTYNYSMCALLSNKIFMPIDLSALTVSGMYSITFATRWVAVGTDGTNVVILESTNGFMWSETVTTVPNVGSGQIFWEQSTNVYYITVGSTLISLTTPGTWTTKNVLTGQEYVGIAGNGEGIVVVIKDTTNSNWVVQVRNNSLTTVTQTNTFPTQIVSVQYDGNRFTIIDVNAQENVSADGNTWTASSPFYYAGLGVVGFTSNVEKILTLNGNALTQETFAIDASVVNVDAQSFESIPSTLQFEVSGTTGNVVTTPTRNEWHSVNAYSSFELTFKTDVYSRKQLNFIAGGESFTFNILEASNLSPYKTQNNVYQTNGYKYNFIQNGIEFAQAIDIGVCYQRLVASMTVCVALYTTLQGLLQGKSQVPAWVDMSMLAFVPFCLNGNNTRTTYNMGTFSSIRALNKVGTTDPITGGSTGNYNLQTLGNILGTLDEDNFDTFERNFAYACLNSGTPTVNFQTGAVESFKNRIDSAMAGPNPYLFATSSARQVFIDQLNKLFSLEYLVSTDYLLDSTDTTSILSSAPLSNVTNLLAGFTSNLQNAISALNLGRLVPSVKTYTAASVFSVRYDGYILSLSVDSVVVNEFYVFSRAPVKIQLISNSYNNPILSQDSMPLPGILGLNTLTLREHPDSSILLKKRIGTIRDTQLASTTRSSFFDKIEKSSLLGAYTVPAVANDVDYFYAVSAFTSNQALLAICGTKILGSSVTMFDQNNFVGSAYDSTFTGLDVYSSISDVATAFEGSFTPTNVFTTLRNSIVSYYDSLGTYAPVRDIRDNKYIVDTYTKMNYVYKLGKVLTYSSSNAGPTYPYTFPSIPGKEVLFNDYADDLDRTIAQYSMLERLGNKFMCRTPDIFGPTIFSDTADNITTLNFLNLFKGLTGLTGNVYEKIFTSFQDAIGVTLIANAICVQQLSPVVYSYNFINSLNNVSVFPEEGSSFASRFSVLGVTLTGGMTLSAGVSLSIYDSSYPTTLTKYYNENYRNNFPDVYSGLKLWSPLNRILPQLTSNLSYIKAFSDVLSTDGYQTPLLDLRAYYNAITSYTGLGILPTISNIADAQNGTLFTNVILPQVNGVIQHAFELDVGNNNKYFTRAETALFLENYIIGSTGAFYAGLTTSSAIITNSYVDMNSVYAAFANNYSSVVQTKLTELIAHSSSDITALSDGILSIINRTYTPLRDYNLGLSRINAQASYYRSTLSGLNTFVRANTIYKNFSDSLARYDQMYQEIIGTGTTGMSDPPDNSSKNFIVSIPPIDSTRWAPKNIPSGKTINSYSRYNSVWKYFERDIVFYKGQLYQCVDTSRRSEIKGIPPGGLRDEQRPDGVYEATVPFLQGIPGTTGYKLVQTAFVTGTTHTSGVQSLLAWEEWHAGPTANRDILSGGLPESDEYLESELSYTLQGVSGGNPYSYEYDIEDYSPTVVYARGSIVRWGNSLFKCRGGRELIEEVGMGIPPEYSQTSLSWVLLGTVGNTIVTPPGSNGVWKRLGAPLQSNRYVDNRYIEYSNTAVYNIGDTVIYNNVIYQRLANGTVLDQAGRTVTITGIPPPSGFTARADVEWVAYPYVDLSVEGRKIPAYTNKFYNAGDLVVYKNLVWKNLLNAGSTGNWVEGTRYSMGDVVVTYDTFKYISLIDANYEAPPYPRNTALSSLYWRKVIDTPTIPAGMEEYNFETDYNLLYHLNAGAPIQVYYDGAVWQWKYDMGLDYNLLGNLSPLLRSGFVIGIEPPAPEPLNDWIVCYPTTNINPVTRAPIYKYSSNLTYRVNDIVEYENMYFMCTGDGLGVAVNEAGNTVETQLFVRSREIDYGRILKDPNSGTRYNETFITTEGVNEDDTSIPKWGSNDEDPWNDAGFARDLRYNLASGLELTYLTLKHDRSVYSSINTVTVPSAVSALLAPSVSFLGEKNRLSGMASAYNAELADKNYRNAEFYYYAPLIKYFNGYKTTVNRLNAEINAIYDDWLLYHTQQIVNISAGGISDFSYGIYGEGLQTYFMVEGVGASIKGLPLYTRQMGLSAFPGAGQVTLVKGDTGGNLQKLHTAYNDFGLSSQCYFDNPAPSGLSVKRGGTTGFFSQQFMGTSGTNNVKNLDGSIAYYVDKNIFENTTGTISMSSLVVGHSAAVAKVEELNDKIAQALGVMNMLTGMQNLVHLLGEPNIADSTPSLYRKNIFQKTGTDYPIYVPILTESDKTYLQTNTEAGWCKGTTGIRKNMWYTGPNTNIKNNNLFANNEWGEEFVYTNEGYKYYLTEQLNFDLKPNFFRFSDVESVYTKLLTMPDAQLKTNSLRSNDPLTWRPFGAIERNVPSWAKERDWKAWNIIIGLGSGSIEHTQTFWGKTSYNEKGPFPATSTNLFEYQGKLSFTNADSDLKYPYMSVLQYMFHIKKCSQLEPSTSHAPFVANALKLVNGQQHYNGSQQEVMNVAASLLIVVVVLASAILTIVTAGAAAPAAVTFSSIVTGILVAAVQAGIMYGIGQLPEVGPFVTAMFSDPSVLFMPAVNTSAGLLARCSLLDSIVDQASSSSRSDYLQTTPVLSLTDYISEKEPPVSYQLYKFSKLERVNIYDNVLPNLAAHGNSNLISVNPGFQEFLADRGITGSALVAYYQNNLNVGTNSEAYEDFLSYDGYLLNNISRYEQELFFPTIFNLTPVSRPAILKISGVQFGRDTLSSSSSSIIPAPNARPQNYTGQVYAYISIIDPGEGFYLLDANGNQVPYREHAALPATTRYTTSGGAILIMQDIELIGRYLYDSADPLKTAVKGLSKFNHLNTTIFGFNRKVQMETTAGAEINDQTITIHPPVYSQMPLASGGVPRSAPIRVSHTSQVLTSGRSGQNYNPSAGKFATASTGRAAPVKAATPVKQSMANYRNSGNAGAPPPRAVQRFDGAKFNSATETVPIKVVKPTPPATGGVDIDSLKPSRASVGTVFEDVPITKPISGQVQLKPVSIRNPPPAAPEFKPPPFDDVPPPRAPSFKPPPPLKVDAAGTKVARWGKGKSFKPPPLPPPLPAPTIRSADIFKGILAVVGVALTITFTALAIVEKMKTPPPMTNCSQISSNNR